MELGCESMVFHRVSYTRTKILALLVYIALYSVGHSSVLFRSVFMTCDLFEVRSSVGYQIFSRRMCSSCAMGWAYKCQLGKL